MASGQLLLPYSAPALSDLAQPISGATLTVYIAGTLNLASIFADSGLVTPITNPQVSNAAGRFFAQATQIWADASQAYDAVLAYPSTGQSFTFQNNYLIGAGSNTSGFAPINSPNFTGVPTAPTPALNDNSTKIATTAFVKGQNYAALNSPALTGTPTAPTAAASTSTTQIATTAFANPGSSQLTSGYDKLPGGLIIQWGNNTLTSTGSSLQTFNIALPLTFPTAILWATGSPANSGSFPGTQPAIGVGGLDTGHVVATWHASGAGNLAVNWIAIGN